MFKKVLSRALVILALILAPAALATGLSVGVSGVWHTAFHPYVGVSGVWKPWKAAWVGVGGTWHQFYAQLTPTTHTFTGTTSASETVLAGASQVTITCYGLGGTGGSGTNAARRAGGGGGGGLVSEAFTLNTGDWGRTLAVSINSGNTKAEVSGTLSSGALDLIANRGGDGTASATTGLGGSGGSASGGTTNTSGSSGTNSTNTAIPGNGGNGADGSAGGAGEVGGSANNGDDPSGGGGGGNYDIGDGLNGFGGTGGVGKCTFAYIP
jgi:hypothetical protein